MAIGDAAAKVGYALVPNTGEEGKVKWGAREINRTRDYIADVKVQILGIWPVSRGGTGSNNAAGARTNLGIGSVATENVVPVTKGGTGATTAANARGNLGLGGLAVLNSVSIALGGTGSTTAAGARSNLGIKAAALDDIVPVGKGGTGASNKNQAKLNLGINWGTANPSGGVDGDMYLRIL